MLCANHFTTVTGTSLDAVDNQTASAGSGCLKRQPGA